MLRTALLFLNTFAAIMNPTWADCPYHTSQEGSEDKAKSAGYQGAGAGGARPGS